jgi:hypothetical protein
VTDDEREERELRIKLMNAQIDNLKQDTTYKRRLADWEPWKAMSAAFAAGAGLMGAVVALFGLILHMMGKL